MSQQSYLLSDLLNRLKGLQDYNLHLSMKIKFSLTYSRGVIAFLNAALGSSNIYGLGVKLRYFFCQTLCSTLGTMRIETPLVLTMGITLTLYLVSNYRQ